MALSDEQIAAQNPWWRNPGWETLDPVLRLLGEQPSVLPAPLVRTLDLDNPGIHTIRGPRQVGKSTDLKLLVKRALAEGRRPTNVIYLSLDLLEDQPIQEMAATIGKAKSLAGSSGQTLVLLDEVTVVPHWQTAVKSLWDTGVISRDVVVCTGSSAYDLVAGASERLPGRRGAGRDHLVLPQSFGTFAKAVRPLIPESPALTLGELSEGPQPAIQEARLHGSALSEALNLYLHFGGLPAAVAEAASGAREPSETTKRILWDSIAREVRRRGASDPALHALLERTLRSLGSKTNWSRLAAEMDVPLRTRSGRGSFKTSSRSVREYVEFLAAGYALMIVYFWKPGSDSSSISKDKKVYLGDPLLHAVAADYAPGLAPDRAALVENAMALALYRKYEPVERQIEGFGAPQDLHVWESERGKEIDFVCGPRSAINAVEVKYSDSVDGRIAAGMKRAFPGRPVVIASKNELALGPAHAVIPAHMLLWLLG